MAAVVPEPASVLDTSDDGLVVVGLDGVVTQANAAACLLLGTPRRQLVGRRLVDVALVDVERHPLRGDAHPVEQVLTGAAGDAVSAVVGVGAAPDVRWFSLGATAVRVPAPPEAERGAVTGAVARFTVLRTSPVPLADLERRAFADPLTGLANRALLHDRLTQAIARHQRRGGGAALLLVDVDHFKSINDRLGHQAGDAVLVQLGERLAGLARSEDTVARMGGEEFAVLLEQVAEPEEAELVARRIQVELARPYELGDRATVVPLTVSIGVALLAEEAADAQALYRQADVALYRAKESGRDRYVVFDARLRAWTDERTSWQDRVRTAFEAGELVALPKPVRDLRTGALVAHHVLAVLPTGDPSRATELSPALVGDARLAAAIDGWLLERAFALPGHDLVEVQVSARTLLQPGLADRLAAAVAAAGRQPREVVVGLAERDLFDHLPGALPAISALRENGMLVALLDLRGDRVPLRRLADLRVHAVCLSSTLLRDATCDPLARATARSMVAMLRELGVVVGTVGLDEQSWIDVAVSLGCEVGSGDAVG